MSSSLPAVSLQPHGAPAVRLRRFGAAAPGVIVIGASTGGPRALTRLLRDLAPTLDVPVAVVLHMPPGFVASMCDGVTRATGLAASVMADGDRLRPGHVHFAAGPLHCRIAGLGADLTATHCDAAPVHFCKPAVDILFQSAADACGADALGIVLTGMGTDGLAGASAIVAAGGSIIAQDEATSVVWGMPGAVARAGLCSAVLPIEMMGGRVAARLAPGGRRARPC